MGATRIPEARVRSSRDLPSRAVLRILQHHAKRGEFIADAIGLREVPGLARGKPCGDAAVDLVRRKRGSRRTRLAPFGKCGRAETEKRERPGERLSSGCTAQRMHFGD